MSIPELEMIIDQWRLVALEREIKRPVISAGSFALCRRNNDLSLSVANTNTFSGRTIFFLVTWTQKH